MVKKKFKSTVLCCAFHPTNGQLLATGAADFKCRVYSTFAADVDGTNVDPGPFGTPLEFGEPYVELSALGWVNSVAWSPSGAILAYAGLQLLFALWGLIDRLQTFFSSCRTRFVHSLRIVLPFWASRDHHPLSDAPSEPPPLFVGGRCRWRWP